MEIEQILNWLNEYGFICVFAISYIEHLNFPASPAGIIYPAYGLWASTFDKSIFMTMLVSTIASYLGAVTLYIVAYKNEKRLRAFLERKFSKSYKVINKYELQLENSEVKANFIANFVPGIRTLVPLPCGFIKMNFKKFTTSTVLSIFIYNLIFFLIGYFIGDTYFETK